jgi:L-aminoadipate-semialdehyde dehydrogenase
MPLYHFATTDLPADTIAPEQDDRNTTTALKSDTAFTGQDRSAGASPTLDTLGNSLAYLVAIGFMPRPAKSGAHALPSIHVSDSQKAALLRVGGRGALV